MCRKSESKWFIFRAEFPKAFELVKHVMFSKKITEQKNFYLNMDIRAYWRYCVSSTQPYKLRVYMKCLLLPWIFRVTPLVKGIVSRDECFLGPRKQTNYVWVNADGFHNFSFFVKKIQKKFLLASTKSLTRCEDSSSNPLQMPWSGDYDHKNVYRNSPAVWNIILEAA